MIMVSEYSFLRVRSPVGTGDDGGDGRSGPAMTWKGIEGLKPVMLCVLCFFV